MAEARDPRWVPWMPLLDPGEKVWAIYPGAAGCYIATDRRLFVPSTTGMNPRLLAEFTALHRVSERVVLLQPVDGPPIRIRVAPTDERGLQALTVIGLLVATARIRSGSGLPGPSAHRPAARTGRRPRRSDAATVEAIDRGRRRSRRGTRPERGRSPW